MGRHDRSGGTGARPSVGVKGIAAGHGEGERAPCLVVGDETDRMSRLSVTTERLRAIVRLP